MGAELLGDDSVEADAEMLALVIESMLTIGLKEFQLTVSNVDFLQSLIEDADLDEDARERVRELITNRNFLRRGRISGKYSGETKLQRSIWQDE